MSVADAVTEVRNIAVQAALHAIVDNRPAYAELLLWCSIIHQYNLTSPPHQRIKFTGRHHDQPRHRKP